MQSWLWKIAVRLLACAIGFSAAALERALWQHRPVTAGTNLESSGKIKATQGYKQEPDSPDDGDVIVEGRYSNFDYAYSALVPPGMMAAMNATPPNPNHGFGIDLTNPKSNTWIKQRTPPNAILWVDASYDSAETKSPNNEIKESISWLREKHTDVRLMSRTPTRLGTLDAVRFVIAFEESDEAMIDDQVVAFRSQLHEGSDIVYSIELTTPAFRYNQDKRLITKIQRSWVIDPLPNDYPLPPADEDTHQ